MRITFNMARKREFLVFCALSGIAFAGLGALFAFFASREARFRKLDLEYRAWQTSSAVMEYFQTATQPESALPFGVTSFGLYAESGASIIRSDKAPDRLPLEDFDGDEVAISGDTLTLVRRLAQAGMGMGMMGWRLRADRRGPRRVGMVPQSEQGEESGQEKANAGIGMDLARGRILFIEMPSGEFERHETLYRIARCAVLLGILGLYALVLWLYGRTLALAEREERNRELVQLGEAARTLAHEIKNPLGIIKLQCATLAKLLPDERKENLMVIGEETERLSLLTDKIGDFLRGQSGAPETVPLSRWSRSFAMRNGLPWSAEAKGDCPVLIDPRRLESIAGNLVENAREAGGPAEGVELRIGVEGSKVRLDVLDRGTGVPPSAADRVFDPFFTTKPRGSGIGLALARKFAQEAGGKLEYRRREGGGSQFSLYLPMRGGRESR